ncbi:MAG: helix-turn-helix domain-containing protein [Cohaesibacter sp.]|jgi:transposase|nr:helix-turn-helix domain-containing protein [Cohaesibacter sp.]
MQNDGKKRIELFFWIRARATDVGVSKACKEAGIGRQTFYDWKNKFLSEGVDGLKTKSKTPQKKRSKSHYLNGQILHYSIMHPLLSSRRLSDLLKGKGIEASSSTVLKYWRDEGISDRISRVQKAEEELLAGNTELTISTKSAIMKNNGFLFDRKHSQLIQINISYHEQSNKIICFYVATEVKTGFSTAIIDIPIYKRFSFDKIIELINVHFNKHKYYKNKIKISIRKIRITKNLEFFMNKQNNQNILFSLHHSSNIKDCSVDKFLNYTFLKEKTLTAIKEDSNYNNLCSLVLNQWNRTPKPFYPFCGMSPNQLRESKYL